MDKKAIEMRYLLGKLSDAESAELEERSFVDDRVFDEIETAEDELIDAYVGGSLSSEDRERFESKLLKSARVTERVEFAKLLSKSAPPQLVGYEQRKTRWRDRLFENSFIQSPAFRGVVIAGFLLAVSIIPALLWMQQRTENRLNLERAAIEQQRQQLAQQLAEQQAKTNQLAADLQTSKAEEVRLQRELQATTEELARRAAQPAALASTFLFSNSVRAPGERSGLNVRSTASTIQLKLVLESDDYASYRATLKSPSNDNILTRPGLKSRRSGQSRIIILELPSRNLSPGEYLVSVSGRAPSGTYEPVADYSLRLSKK
jgi:type II secretory pathway pseudopilin PulG